MIYPHLFFRCVHYLVKLLNYFIHNNIHSGFICFRSIVRQLALVLRVRLCLFSEKRFIHFLSFSDHTSDRNFLLSTSVLVPEHLVLVQLVRARITVETKKKAKITTR